MVVRTRKLKARGALNEYEAAWLQAEEHGWLVGLNHDDALQALWDRAGSHDTMYWEPGMHFPESIEE
jgi:hypothetical protein